MHYFCIKKWKGKNLWYNILMQQSLCKLRHFSNFICNLKCYDSKNGSQEIIYLSIGVYWYTLLIYRRLLKRVIYMNYKRNELKRVIYMNSERNELKLVIYMNSKNYKRNKSFVHFLFTFISKRWTRPESRVFSFSMYIKYIVKNVMPSIK